MPLTVAARIRKRHGGDSLPSEHPGETCDAPSGGGRRLKADQLNVGIVCFQTRKIGVGGEKVPSPFRGKWSKKTCDFQEDRYLAEPEGGVQRGGFILVFLQKAQERPQKIW